MLRLHWPIAIVAGLLLFLQPFPCCAQWSGQDISCPKGTVYRDLRPDAGRQEFCERLLPGSLRVKDGPFRFWFSADHPGDQGDYRDGRQVGIWTECDRFGKCRQTEYHLIDASEKQRSGFRPVIPVSYENGKYIFDFRSCWSTWITKSGTEDLNLNIGGDGNRCDISYIPQHVIDHGGTGDYFCSVPFSVGQRRLDSIDLMHELTKLGLPQFCRTIGGKPQALMLVDKEYNDVASAMDIACAVVVQDSDQHPVLTFTLNPFVSELATDLTVKEGPLIGRGECIGKDETISTSQGADGQTHFAIPLSNKPDEASKQRQCLAKAIHLKPLCN
jgi:hypothetical protein